MSSVTYPIPLRNMLMNIKREKSNGNYYTTENENVVLLKNYRDLALLDSKLGAWFVNQYYRFSPSIVNFFEQIKFPKRLLRFLLSTIIKILPK